VPATQFIQIGEFVDALTYMNTKPEWQRYLEVLPLDGKIGDGAGNDEKAAFPGNNLGNFEFTPSSAYVSAGLPTPQLERTKSDLMMVRVTDESVPDAGKKRYAISLSIHGIERAGVEGGTRAMEDLATAATTGKFNERILPAGVHAATPTFGDVLKKSIIYFIYPNPDGWRRGSISEGGVFFQRYNGNGVDVNRDWPDIGFSFRPYSGLSEPESRAFSSVLTQIRDGSGRFTAGDDLHGQPFADALSFTLLPHGRHDFQKDFRIRESAKTIHRASESALLWSPIVQPNDAPRGGGAPCTPNAAVGEMCAKIYGQTWGSVYDTINYTTTGALGDWFDSSVGLGADGIDNEMSFSHLDKNIVFEPQTEQLHVDGNKSLIYAHLAEMLAPQQQVRFSPPGPVAYVANKRLSREEKSFQPAPPPGTVAQTPTDGTAVPDTNGQAAFGFDVKRGPQPPGGTPNIFNGGMRVEVTTSNFQGVSSGLVTLRLQCKNCDEHPGVKEADDFVTVQEDFNQSPLYAQAGITVALNRPQAFGKDGKPVEWRAVLDGPTTPSHVHVEFTQGPATGDAAGGPPPILRGYDIANTDFFNDLNKYIDKNADHFHARDIAKVVSGDQKLDGLSSLVLADDPMPGYLGRYEGEGTQAKPSGPPTANKQFSGTATIPGAGTGAPGTTEDHEFTIGPNDGNESMTVTLSWGNPTYDFDLEVFRKKGDEEEPVDDSGGSPPSTKEQVTVPNPPAGDYIVRVTNYAAPNPANTVTVEFKGGAQATGTGDFSLDQKNAWVAKLKSYVSDGGNLVLTDGALRVLPELTRLAGDAVKRQRVYAGQVTFASESGKSTLLDPLSRNVAQDGARFNAGGRRQTFEPTPLGFSIQNQATGADSSQSRQYDIDKAKFVEAGGRVAGTSVDSGDRDAVPVYDRVTLGEIKLGKGQIRVVGGLLPQPTEEFDHTLGLEPYAVTYTGYILVCNLVGATCPVGVIGDAGPGARGASAAGCRDRFAPRTTIRRRSTRFTRRGLRIYGRSRDRYCRGAGAARLRYPGRVKRVEVAIARFVPHGCRFLGRRGRFGRRRNCRRPVYVFRARTRYLRKSRQSAFSLKKRLRLPRGRYAVLVRGVDFHSIRESKRRRARVLHRRLGRGVFAGDRR
jgi:hypothetical protein